MAGDPNWSSVVLLCDFDGTNGATTTTDSSPLANTITRTTGTGCTLDTTQTKFGATSTLLPSIAGPRWNCADSASWQFTGQFTVECWIYPTTLRVAKIIGQWAGGSKGWMLGFSDATHAIFYYSLDGSTNPNLTGAWSPSLNAWHHFAVDRDGSNILRLYGDGVVLNSATVSGAFWDSTGGLQFCGDDGSLWAPIIGWCDELRITKGVARYAGAFTPPTAAFPQGAFVSGAAAGFLFAA